MDPLEWKNTEESSLSKLIKEINSSTKKILVKEINDVYGKLESLRSMGIIKNNDKLDLLKQKINEINTTEVDSEEVKNDSVNK